VWADYEPLPPLTWEELRRLEEAGCGTDCPESQRFYNAYVAKAVKDAERKTRAGKPLDETEHMMIKARERMNADVASNDKFSRTAMVTLEYDAENGFGALVRSFAGCRFTAIGADGRFEQRDIVLEGPIPESEGREAKRLSALRRR
jgi:hypothetical protein